MAAQESGLQLDEHYKEEDIFELQHHHLLRCLEKTTVSVPMLVSRKRIVHARGLGVEIPASLPEPARPRFKVPGEKFAFVHGDGTSSFNISPRETQNPSEQ